MSCELRAASFVKLRAAAQFKLVLPTKTLPSRSRPSPHSTGLEKRICRRQTLGVECSSKEPKGEVEEAFSSQQDSC